MALSSSRTGNPATTAAMRGANKVSNADACYDSIKRQIITNVLHPGTAIDERELAEELGVSRTPVREALLKLRSEGFIDMIPRRGTVIRTLTVDDLKHLYEVVTGLEVMAVGLIAENGAQEGQLAALDDACDRMQEAVGASPTWTEADEEFHRMLLEFSGNPLLARTGLLHRELAQRAHFIADRARPKGTEHVSIENHKALVALLRAGDVEGARNNHFHQRESGARKLLQAIQDLGLRSL